MKNSPTWKTAVENLSKYLRINFLNLMAFSALMLNHFKLPLQVNHNRFKSLNTPRNHRTSMSLGTYNWSESMDFIHGRKFKLLTVHCCQGNSSLFLRRCTEGLWRKLIISFMRKWVNKQTFGCSLSIGLCWFQGRLGMIGIMKWILMTDYDFHEILSDFKLHYCVQSSCWGFNY